MATLKDIAKVTSFSVSTVSVVLRGDASKFGICQDTVKEIQRAAAKLGYVKNDYARTMASGKSRLLAFITDPKRNVEYRGRLLSGMLEEISFRDYSLRIFNYDPSSEDELLLKLQSQRIKGVVLSGELHKDVIESFIPKCLKHKIMCATVNHSNQICGVGAESDDIAGVAMVADYLFENGHRNIAYCGRMNEEEYSQKRLNGYLNGMQKYGLTPHVYDYSKDFKLKELIQSGITAVACESDYVGASILQHAYSNSVNVPEDISVCGFGGMEISDFAARPMTTVVQDFVSIGRSAVQMLIDALEKPDFMKGRKIFNIAIKTALKVKQTTGKINQIKKIN